MHLALNLALLLGLLSWTVAKGSGDPSITLTSSVNITSGAALCRNMPEPVVFTCVAVEASFLSWQRNGNEIEPNFNIGDTPRTVVTGPYNLSLDEIRVGRLRQVANLTSRLAVNLTDLMNGDQLTCKELVVQDSLTLRYKIQAAPPVPKEYTILLDPPSPRANSVSTVAFNFTSNPIFDSNYAITGYKIRPLDGNSKEVAFNLSRPLRTIECPPLCSSAEPCQCTGLEMGQRVIVAISAVNCGDQEGPVIEVTVTTSCPAEELQVPRGLLTDCSCQLLEQSLRNSTWSSVGGTSVSFENGNAWYNTTMGTYIGSTATYQCNKGYTLIGNPQRVCQIDGHWSGDLPHCVKHNSGLPSSTLLIFAVLSTSILSFTLGIAVTTLVLYCYMRARHHHKPPDSLTSKQLHVRTQQATHSKNTRASEYQDIPVYQEVKELKVPESPLRSTKLDMDVSLMQNSAYGRIYELEASTLEDKANENSESVIVNPIYS